MTLRNRVYRSLHVPALVTFPSKVSQTKTPRAMPTNDAPTQTDRICDHGT